MFFVIIPTVNVRSKLPLLQDNINEKVRDIKLQWKKYSTELKKCRVFLINLG